MAKQILNEGRRWYAIHVYSGYEEIVANNIKQKIATMHVEDKIFNVIVPIEKKIKIKNGKRKVVEEKFLPGYVLLDMIIDDESWYIVRNTPNVTAFIGSGFTPVPMSPEEVADIQKKIGIEEPKYKIDFVIGSPVKIVDGAFKNVEGKVSEIDEAKGKLKVMISMFDRDVAVKLDVLQVKKI